MRVFLTNFDHQTIYDNCADGMKKRYSKKLILEVIQSFMESGLHFIQTPTTMETFNNGEWISKWNRIENDKIETYDNVFDVIWNEFSPIIANGCSRATRALSIQ